MPLGEVVVTGSRNAIDVRHLPMTVSVIDRGIMTKYNEPSLLPAVMEHVPGLFLTSRGVLGYGVSGGASGGISLRGVSASSGQMLVLIDGHPQYQGIYGHPISDAYQTLLAERVEVLRGPASMLYGSNAMGGVINIVTRESSREGGNAVVRLGAGSYGTFESEASATLRLNAFSGMAAAQYNRSDNHRPRMGFEQYGGHIKLGYDISSHWKTAIDADLMHFNASQPGETSKPKFDANQWITRGNASLMVENHYSRTSGGFSFFTNFGRHKIDDGTEDPEKPTKRFFRSKDALTGFSAFQSATLFEGNRLTAGVDFQHIYGHAYYTSKATGEVLDTPNKQSGRSYRNEIAGYVDFRQDLFKLLTLDAGIRIDHHSITGTEWIPQAGIVVRPIQNGEIKAMASKGFRNPTMKELYLYPSSTVELEPERLWNYELSWRHRLANVSYGINLFYINGDNMIQTIANKNVNTGEIKNCGAEVELKWRIDNHWSVNTNHAVLHMKKHVVAAPEYKGFFGCDFTSGRWSANANLLVVAGLFTAVGENEKKENFALLNACVSYRAHRNIALWLRGENLLAQKYEINHGYPMPKATVMAGVNFNINY